MKNRFWLAFAAATILVTSACSNLTETSTRDGAAAITVDIPEIIEISEESAPQTPTTAGASTSEAPTTTAPAPTQIVLSEDSINQLGQRLSGFKNEDIAFGSDVDFSRNVEQERGAAAFGFDTLESPEEIATFLEGNDPRQEAALEMIVEAMDDQGVSQADQDAIIRDLRWFPIQFVNGADIVGTSYFLDGEAVVTTSPRRVGDGDVVWFPVSSSGDIIFGAAIRADCSNPGFDHASPPEDGTPPVEEPPTTTEPPATTVTTEGNTTTTTEPSTTTTSEAGTTTTTHPETPPTTLCPPNDDRYEVIEGVCVKLDQDNANGSTPAGQNPVTEVDTDEPTLYVDSNGEVRPIPRPTPQPVVAAPTYVPVQDTSPLIDENTPDDAIVVESDRPLAPDANDDGTVISGSADQPLGGTVGSDAVNEDGSNEVILNDGSTPVESIDEASDGEDGTSNGDLGVEVDLGGFGGSW